MNIKNSLNLVIILLVVFFMAISGCTSTDEQNTINSGTNGTSSDSYLVLGEMWDIDGIDPAEDGTVLCEKAACLETLVGANDDFSLKPSLAESWERLDNTTWQFNLRDDVLFHDGSKMTAEDVKFSLERVIGIDPRVESMLMIDSIEAVDDYTLKITTTQVNPILAGVLHYPNTAIISGNSVDSEGNLVEPIGTGPYAFESFDEQTRVLTVVRNDNWWGGEVGLDGIILRGIADPNTRAMAIESGEVDFTVDVPYSETDRIDALDGISVEKYMTPRVYKIDLNLAHQPLDDVRVRQAISYAIDRAGIAEHVLYNVGQPAAGPFLPTMVWANKDLEPYEQDFEVAADLLTEAGWVDTDGDGIRDKDGVDLELNLMTYSERPGLPPMAETIAAQLKNVGIDVTAEVMDFGAITDNKESGDWDLYLAAFNLAMVPDPEYVLSGWYYTGGSNNAPGYSNPEVDALIDEARNITDQDLRYQKFNEVEAIVYEEQPMIIVAYYGCAIVKKDTVTGYVFDPTAHDYRINAAMTMES
jgi:peptide/nickel transport system substrate-binding protein